MMNECGICLIENINCNYKLSCGHIFHMECIRQWDKRTCPMCRCKYKMLSEKKQDILNIFTMIKEHQIKNKECYCVICANLTRSTVLAEIYELTQ